MQHKEQAKVWLVRVVKESASQRARILAQYALNEWSELCASWKERGVKSRRSLWDLLAGVYSAQRGGTHHALQVPVRSGERTYYIPVFIDACGRRGRVEDETEGVYAGVDVRSERLPQKRWGNKLCKT